MVFWFRFSISCVYAQHSMIVNCTFICRGFIEIHTSINSANINYYFQAINNNVTIINYYVFWLKFFLFLCCEIIFLTVRFVTNSLEINTCFSDWTRESITPCGNCTFTCLLTFLIFRMSGRGNNCSSTVSKKDGVCISLSVMSIDFVNFCTHLVDLGSAFFISSWN